MTKRLAGLEALRGSAALYVFMHHLDPLQGTRFHALFHYGQEAVMLFFVLSGFVIYYASTKPGASVGLWQYLSSRTLRIFPIFIASLTIAALSAAASHQTSCIQVSALLGNLAMLQDAGVLKPGTVVDPFCGNSPLWSLSYEWWFYMLFAGLFFGMRNVPWSVRRAMVYGMSIIGAITYIFHPNAASLFVAYFSIWWGGVELALEHRNFGRATLRGQILPQLGLFAVACIWLPGAVHQAISTHQILPGTYPGLPARHFFFAWLVIFGATIPLRIPAAIKPLERALSTVGTISFGLYASHEPIIALVDLMNLGKSARLIVCLLVVLSVAWLLERVYQPALTSVLRRERPPRLGRITG